MHDIKKIRKNPDDFDENLSRRKIPPTSISILKLDTEKRHKIASLETLQAQLNKFPQKN